MGRGPVVKGQQQPITPYQGSWAQQEAAGENGIGDAGVRLHHWEQRLRVRHDRLLLAERDLARAWNPHETPRPGSDPSWVVELLYLELSRRCFVSLLRQAQAAFPGKTFGYPEG